jgi:phage tail-like protein
MPRPRLNDLMQQHSFWLFDAGILGGNVLFPVFDPSLAFATASTPEITATEHEIVTGNWQFSRRFIKSATVSPIVLGRGVRFYDSDMYNWITAAILGKDPVRRSLCLMHFLGLRSGGRAGQIIGGAATGALTGALSGGLSSAAQGAVGGAILGGFINNRIPGRLWMLHDCIPTRYKAGGDFDASSGAVSIQELEVQPEHVVEVTVSTLSGVQGAIGSVKGAINVVEAL